MMELSLAEQLAGKFDMTVPHGQHRRSFPKMTESDIHPGTIVYAPLTNHEGLILKSGYSSRDKFFAIVGVSQDGYIEGSLLINTHAAYGNEEIRQAQKLLHKADYDFLDYDSWLDCSQLFRVPKVLILKSGGNCGQLIPTDWTDIHNYLIQTDFIDEDTKHEFGII